MAPLWAIVYPDFHLLYTPQKTHRIGALLVLLQIREFPNWIPLQLEAGYRDANPPTSYLARL
jgi:hypothetical protein